MAPAQLTPFPFLAQVADSNPAGGAAIAEAAAATAAGVVATVVLLWVGWAHRSGRIAWLGSLAALSSRLSGMAPWVALPAIITTGSLITAAFGMYWDISLHVSTGRDAGPFANPAHFFILGGLFGIFVAGMLAVVLPEGKPSPVAVRIGRDWYAPLGGLGLLVASAFALVGFPLDDVWHRIFGQDVTLWGPTHLMLLGGAALSFVGLATLLGEGRPHETGPERGGQGRVLPALAAVLDRARYPSLAGGFLIALSIFQAEFDFGVPQFRLLFGPVLIVFAAAAALVAARIYGGRGAALFAVVFFLAFRGGLALIVGPIFGEPTPHFPLYLGSALLVEGLALALDCRRRPLLFGLGAGALIGTVGLAPEYAWTHLFMPIPWNGELIAEAAVPAALIGPASGLLGGWIATAWRTPLAPQTTPRLALLPAVAGVVAIVALIGYGLQTEPEREVTASVELREVAPAPERTVAATIRIEPPAAVEDANFLNVTGWQGGGLHLDELEPVPGAGAGTFRSTEPIPVSGTWKSTIRLHRDDSLIAMPIFMPEDAAIPAPEVPAPAGGFERRFQADHEILQREQVGDVAGWLTSAAYAAVGAIVLLILVLMGWSLNRLNAAYAAAGPGGRSEAGLGRSRPGRVSPAGSHG